MYFSFVEKHIIHEDIFPKRKNYCLISSYPQKGYRFSIGWSGRPYFIKCPGPKTIRLVLEEKTAEKEGV